MPNGVKITPEQCAQYQRDGAILVRNVLNDAEIRLLEHGLEEAFANPGEYFSKYRSSDGEGETLIEQFPSLHCPSLRKLLDVGHIPEIAARLMECSSAQLILDQIFYKTRGYVNPTPWHQDTPFLRVRGHEMARVWVTCDFSPSDLTVQVVRGSHRWNVVFNTPAADGASLINAEEGEKFTYDGIGNDSLPVMPDVARYRDSFDILSWSVAPGDALVFNGNILHGAEGRNYFASPRRAFTSMWGGPELRYLVPEGNAIPTLAELNGRIVPHGARIGDFEDVFAVGWKDEPV